jgi:DNA-binding beta-propeller fold protein YncE
VADNGNCRIVVYSILGGKLATFGDSFDSVTLGPLLKDAQGVTLSNNGRQLFVCDAGNHCVRVFDTETGGYLRSIGSGPGKGPGGLNYPTSIGISHFGDIYVADTLNSRIQVRFSALFIRCFLVPTPQDEAVGP